MANNVYKSLLFLALFVSLHTPCMVNAESLSRKTIDLSGTWNIHLEEKRHAVPTEWDEIILPGYIADFSVKKTGSFIGIAWLKKTVYIPSDWPHEDLGICMGRISNADETFFNGEKIGGEGRFPPDEMSRWYIPRHYFISKNLIKWGDYNDITVRVWFHTFGDIKGKMFIEDFDSWKLDRDTQYFVRVTLNFVIIAAGLPLLFLFFLFYIQRPESVEYFYYVLQLVCGFFIIFDLCNLWPFPGGIEARFKSIAYSWIAINVVHPIFLHRLYNFNRPRIERMLVAYAVSSVPVFYFVNSQQFRGYGLFVVLISGSIGFYNLSCHVSAIWMEKPFAKYFAIFGITVVSGAIHDGLIYMSKLTYFNLHIFGYTFDYMIFPYSAAALYTGTAIILVYRFIELLKTNEDLNENLENKVSERTRSLILLTEELEKQNIRLEEMAIRDGLTGLYNHAAFCDRLDEIFMTSRRNKMPLALAMIDVDDFKGFNDTYGHQVGDQVLREIAKILRSSIREYDFQNKYQGHRMQDNRDYDLAGRYGGDEFMMVLPQCYKDDAMMVTQRICDKVHAIQINGHRDLTVSGSFGLAILNPGVPCSGSEKLINLADMALYRSKSLGKNRVFCIEYPDR